MSPAFRLSDFRPQVGNRPSAACAGQERRFVARILDLHKKPVKTSGRLHDVFVENFRKDLAEIQSPVVRHLFILARAKQLIHLRIAEYVALIEMADMTGHFAVGVLLESCLADKLAFAERTRRLIRHIVAPEAGKKPATAAA